MLRNLLKSPIPQWWGKWKSDSESIPDLEQHQNLLTSRSRGTPLAHVWLTSINVFTSYTALSRQTNSNHHTSPSCRSIKKGSYKPPPINSSARRVPVPPASSAIGLISNKVQSFARNISYNFTMILTACNVNQPETQWHVSHEKKNRKYLQNKKKLH